jgi:muconate cycloisomerase
MRITSIHATAVCMPRVRMFHSSLGAADATENAVVEIETDGNVTGIGEASSIWGRRGRGEAEVINQLLGPALVGMDPFRVNEAVLRMNHLVEHSYPAKAGVEMALFDLVGKSLGAPLYALLGGKVRERIALSHSLSMGPSGEVASEAQRLVDQGYKTIKAKIGRDLRADLESIEAVRDRVGGDIRLRVDANMGWRSAKEAIRNIKLMEQFDLELVEQPLDRRDLDGMRMIREHTDVPIMADESVWTPEEALRCVQASAADVFNIYVSEAGGLGSAARIFAIAEAAHVLCMIGSMPELGIGTAAQAHLALAMPHIHFACDTNGFVYHADDVVCERFDIRDGYLYVSDEPGLGFTLDHGKLEKYKL